MPSTSSSGFLPTLRCVQSPLDKARPAVQEVSLARWLLGQKDERHEQRGHAEQDAVVRRAAAADALLQLGNFGVKNIWDGGGGAEKECEGRQKVAKHCFIINSSS